LTVAGDACATRLIGAASVLTTLASCVTAAGAAWSRAAVAVSEPVLATAPIASAAPATATPTNGRRRRFTRSG
jgi:hypothetical protein